MAITGKVVLPAGDKTEGNQTLPVDVEVYNSDPSNIGVLKGLSLTNPEGNLILGDFPLFSPTKYQIVSGGTAVTSSVPKWGTGEQPTQTIVGTELIYWVGDISGSSLVAVDYAGNVLLPSASTSQVSVNAQPAVVFLAYGSGSNDSTSIYESSFSGSTPATGSKQGDVKIKTSPSKFGTSGSILFDGTGDVVSWKPEGGNITGLNLSSSASSTIECFFWSDDNTTYQPLISQGDTTTVWALFVSGTEVKVSGSDAAYLNAGGQTNGEVTSSAVTINTGEWNHLAVVKTPANLSFYLNGTRTDELALTTGYSSSAGQDWTNLGAEKKSSPSLFFSGSITNARISTTAQYSGSSFTTGTVPFTNPTTQQTLVTPSTTTFRTSVTPSTYPLIPSYKLDATVGANVEVSGAVSAVAAQTELISLRSKPIKGVVCGLVGTNEIVYQSQFARSPAFKNFDAYVQTDIVYTDGTTWTIPLNGVPPEITMDFTSSNSARVAVNKSGSWSSTTSSYQLTNSVGSVYGGQETQLSGGAGALTFTFPTQPNPIPEWVTISNRLSEDITGSVQVGLAPFQVVAILNSPSQLSIVSGTITDINAYAYLDNGQIVPLDENGGGEPTWESTDTVLVPVSVSGSITGSVNTQANVLITSKVGGFSLVGTTQVTLNKK